MLKILDRLEEVFIAFLMAAATIIIFLAVLHRYSLGVPWFYDVLYPIDMSWAQELCIYMFIWMAKFGAAYGVRTGIHVGVDVLVKRLAPKPRGRVIVFSLLAGAFFTGVVGTIGAIFVYRMSFMRATSNDLEIPMWIVYLAIPLGSYLMCFRFLQVCWHFVRSGELPSHDHAHVEGIETPEPAKP